MSLVSKRRTRDKDCMELHHLLQQLRVEFFISLSPHSDNFYTALLMLTFSFAFLAVGVVRLVEWQGVGFSKIKRFSFCILQVIGSVCTSLGFAIFAIDPHGLHKTLLTALIGVGFLTLFPIQIYLALVRRVKSGNQ